VNGEEDLLSDLEPEKRISGRTAKILSMAESIESARARKCSWKIIAARLEKADIHISAEHLRLVMKRYRSAGKPSSKASLKPRRPNPSKPAQKTLEPDTPPAAKAPPEPIITTPPSQSGQRLTEEEMLDL
jgi:hypothetical protein